MIESKVQPEVNQIRTYFMKCSCLPAYNSSRIMKSCGALPESSVFGSRRKIFVKSNRANRCPTSSRGKCGHEGKTGDFGHWLSGNSLSTSDSVP